jgi:hypothetical protein
MNVLYQNSFLRWVVSTSPNPQAGGPPLTGCPRLLIRFKVEPWFTNLIRSWRPFVARNVRKPKLLWYHVVLFINNTLKKPQNTIKFKRRHGEFEQRCVPSESYTATDALPPILPASRQPLLPACVFVTRETVRHPRRFLFRKFFREPICSWWEAFVNRFVRDERHSWTAVPLYL